MYKLSKVVVGLVVVDVVVVIDEAVVEVVVMGEVVVEVVVVIDEAVIDAVFIDVLVNAVLEELVVKVDTEDEDMEIELVLEGSSQFFGLAIRPQSKPTTKIIIKPIDINVTKEAFENSTPRVILLSYFIIQLIKLF